jgi:hypothetical protein
VQVRTVRNQKQVLVRWRPGLIKGATRVINSKIQRVLKRNRDGTSLVLWRDSWEKQTDVCLSDDSDAAADLDLPNSPKPPSPIPSSSDNAQPRKRNAPAARGSQPQSSSSNTSSSSTSIKTRKKRNQRRKKPKRATDAPSEFLAYEFEYKTPPSSDRVNAQKQAVEPSPSKRRTSAPEKWKRNNRVKKAVSEKPPCGCALKCFNHIGRKRRKQIRTSFQQLDRPQQKTFLRGLIDLHAVKFKGKALQVRKRKHRVFTAQYHLKTSSQKREHVCLKAFIAILGIGSKQVKNLNDYAWANPDGALVPADGRGKHDSRPNRIPPNVVARIDSHIKSFPREDSHYSLNTNNKFLSADLSVRKMHQLYLAKYEPHIHLPGADSDEDKGKADADANADKEQQKPQVTYDFYNERFRTFDLKFGLPTVDSCSSCDELKSKIDAAEDEDTATALRAELLAHLIEADRGYAMRKHDEKLAQESRAGDPSWACPVEEHASWDATEFVCSDMAGVLTTPRVSANKAFYLRKLNTYCYGLFSGQANQHSLAFWNETMAKKGCNEVISSAHRFFVLRNTGSTRLSWWGDNTSSQMHNQFLMLYNNELVREDGFAYFHRVDNKYSPPGHTYMENDRAFGVISRKAKRTKIIGSSKAWMRLAQKSKQPNYHTMWMERSEFRDWKTYLSTKYKRPSQWKNTDGDTVPFMKIRWFNYGVGEHADGTLVKHPNEVWYRLSLDPKESWKRIPLERGLRVRDTGVISDARYELYPEALALNPKKVADLAKFKAWLPQEFHALYPDPPPASRKRKRGGDDDKDGDNNDAADADDVEGQDMEEEDDD